MRYSILTLIGAVAAVPTAQLGALGLGSITGGAAPASGSPSASAPKAPIGGGFIAAGRGGWEKFPENPDGDNGCNAGEEGVVDALGNVVCNVLDTVNDLVDDLTKRQGPGPVQGFKGPSPPFGGRGPSGSWEKFPENPDGDNGCNAGEEGVIDALGNFVCQIVDTVEDVVDDLTKRGINTGGGNAPIRPPFFGPGFPGGSWGSGPENPDGDNGCNAGEEGVVDALGNVICNVLDTVNDVVDDLTKKA